MQGSVNGTARMLIKSSRVPVALKETLRYGKISFLTITSLSALSLPRKVLQSGMKIDSGWSLDGRKDVQSMQETRQCWYLDINLKQNSMKEFNLEEAKAGKPLCNRDGEPVKILKWDGRGENPLVGYVEANYGDLPCSWNKKGEIGGPGGKSKADLMMATTERVMYANIFLVEGCFYTTGDLYPTKESAKENQKDGCITIAEVKWEEYK